MPVQKPHKKNVLETRHNIVSVIRGGKDYFDKLLELIDTALYSIHLQVYILSDDETGMLVTDALLRAAKRGVAVYMLADGYASRSLPGHFIRDVKEGGIHFRFFEPLFKNKNFYFGRRLHHKVFVADSTRSLVGGVNISNRYNDMPGAAAWLDFALYAEGEIARQLCVLCVKTWNNYFTKTQSATCNAPLTSLDPQAFRIPVRMRRNDWVNRKNDISSTYVDMLRTAQQEIVIFCSYFLPGKVIRKLLAKAVARGVSVKVVTAGRSDVLVSKYAERWLYDWLLRHRIDLYEYEPNVLHAKVAVCDGKWFTIGSYNINNISAYATVELNLDVHDETTAAALRSQLLDIIGQDCTHVTTGIHLKSKNIFTQLLRWCAYQFIRVVFFMFTFYFKRKSTKHLAE